MQIFH